MRRSDAVELSGETASKFFQRDEIGKGNAV